MIRDVKHLLEAKPFVPFTIVTSGGRSYHVPTPDHAGINPTGSRVVIWFDDDSSVTIAALHITAIETVANASS